MNMGVVKEKNAVSGYDGGINKHNTRYVTHNIGFMDVDLITCFILVSHIMCGVQ